MDTLYKLVDSLSEAKINYFHLHISDDDSMPLDLPSFPNMIDHTAWSKKETYSVKEMQDFVRYAESHGIKVIPEFDIPGHSRAFGQDPDIAPLVTCMDHAFPFTYRDDGSKIHGGPWYGALNPAMDGTFDFIKKLTKDIATIFYDAEFLHFGGDEVVLSCWRENPEVQKFMEEH
jgi:hexosaminidase